MKPWYQYYEASLLSGVGVDRITVELPKFGRWLPFWILPNPQIRTQAVFYIRKAVYKIWK